MMTTLQLADITTAGIVIIGDEVLKGYVQDTNSCFIAKRLHSLGVIVKRVTVVPDEIDDIGNVVKEFADAYSYVIVAGGIGPTHDDVTYEGIARAFQEDLVINTELEGVYKRYFGTKFQEAHKKVLLVPKSSCLAYAECGTDANFPIVIVKNVYVFPGVPFLLQRVFPCLDERFRNRKLSFVTRNVYVTADEMSIAKTLEEFSRIYKASVRLGSYPEWHNNYYKVKLVLESSEQNLLEEASESLKKSLPDGCIANYTEDPVACAVERVYALAAASNSKLSQLTRHALDIIQDGLTQYTVEEVCIGFNGGKDCTALLHLFYAAVKKLHPDYAGKLNALYIRSKTPFPEVELFIEKCAPLYNLNIMHFDGRIKDQLARLKEFNPRVKAVLMGTRRDDPYSSRLPPFAMTDPDWPPYMRINPVLDWSYKDVWQFLRELSLPYCSLYDVGYTSLGSIENTHPNPSLRRLDANGIPHYKPAYLLDSTDYHLERAGRNDPDATIKPSH